MLGRSLQRGPRDVDLSDAAHAVFVEEGSDGVSGFPPALNVGQLVQESLVLDVLQKSHNFGMRADHVRNAQQCQTHLRGDVVRDGLTKRVGRVFSPNQACSWSLSHHVASIADMNT